MPEISILIPSKDRPSSLAILLTSLHSQTFQNFSIVIADQSKNDIFSMPFIKTVIRMLKQKHAVSISIKRPKNGIAEQREFLLKQSNTPYSLYLDDDLILEPFVLEILIKTIKENNCGFVGNAPIGLGFKDNFHPLEQDLEFWEKKVMPEEVIPLSKEWQRYKMNNAANILYLQQKLKIFYPYYKKYKIAWVGGCVLYNTKLLKKIGGFSFWQKLPKNHCGEEVFVQLQMMKKFGGCGVIPSGVYHQEAPTTLPNRRINAPEFLLDNGSVQQESIISPLLPNALYMV